MPPTTLAAALTEISVTGVLLVVVNLLIALAVGVIGWSLRRLVAKNDEEHGRADEKIDRLTGALESERKTREEDIKALDGKIYRSDINVAENVAKRAEVMRMYGTLTRQVNDGFSRLADKLDALPCKRPDCPPAAKD